MDIGLGHFILVVVAFTAGLCSDNRKMFFWLSSLTVLVFAVFCLAWQTSNDWPGLFVPEFAPILRPLVFIALGGSGVGFGVLFLVKLQRKSVPGGGR